MLNKCPIIDKVTLEECLSNGWISNYIVYNLGVSFTSSEREKYDKADKAFKYLAHKISYGGKNSFEVASKWIKEGSKEERGQAARYFNALRARKKLCVESVSKLSTTVDIINKFSDRKTIVFSENIKFAEALKEKLPDVTEVFHSKMKKKEKELAMTNFKDNKSRVVSSVKALSAGIDIPDISLGIVASGNSSRLTQIQQIGRTVRALPNKLAIFINLYMRDSQDYNWLLKRQEDFERNGISAKWVEFLEEIPK